MPHRIVLLLLAWLWVTSNALPEQPQEPKPAPAVEKPVLKDPEGQPLPPGAVARLGSARLKHGGQVSGLIFSADGKTLISGARTGGSLRMWDSESGKEIGRAAGVVKSLVSLRLGGDGQTLLSIGWQEAAWGALPANKEKQRLGGDRGLGHPVAVSADGKRFAYRSWNPPNDFTIRIGDAASGKEVFQLEGHTATPTALTFSADGKLLVSGGMDQTIRLWDLTTGKQKDKWSGQNGIDVDPVLLSPNDKVLATCSNNELRLWAMDTGKNFRR